MLSSWTSRGSAAQPSSPHLQATLHCPASVDVLQAAEDLAAEHGLRVSARGLSSVTFLASRSSDKLSLLQTGGAPTDSFTGGRTSFMGGSFLASGGVRGSFLGRLVGAGAAEAQGRASVQVDPGDAEFGGRVKVSVTAAPPADGFFNAFVDSMAEAANRAADLQDLDDFLASSSLAEAPGESRERSKRRSLGEWYGGDRNDAARGDEGAEERPVLSRGATAVFAMSRGASRRTSVATEVCGDLEEEHEAEVASTPPTSNCVSPT
mmetsp:Transcript_28223/g.73822  ORF Transcript_28223/g.73822 Transcript_28223/m.73822 type:complete len:264 (-) Transcript_28223:207-998(-)